MVKNEELGESIATLDSFESKENLTLRPLVPFIGLEVLFLVIPFGIFREQVLQKVCPSVLVYAPTLLIITVLLISIPLVLFSMNHIKDGLGLQRESTVHLYVTLIAYALYILNLVKVDLIINQDYSATFAIIAMILSNAITVIYPLCLLLAQARNKMNLKIDTGAYQLVINDASLFKKLKTVTIYYE